jgi:mannose/fructose/N-acetylgalactosamine-specific phosphotransferase system component IIC
MVDMSAKVGVNKYFAIGFATATMTNVNMILFSADP